MVQQTKEARRCVICNSAEVIVDVSQIIGYRLNWDTMKMEYDSINSPKHYCKEHFMSEVWNKKGKS